MLVCQFYETDNPLISATVGNARYHFPNLPLTCPIKKGRYGQTNVTIPDANGWDLEKDALNAFLTAAPNGLYNSKFQFYSPEDPVGFALLLQYEQKNRMTQGNF